MFGDVKVLVFRLILRYRKIIYWRLHNIHFDSK